MKTIKTIKCADCGNTWREDKFKGSLEDIPDLAERLDPGGEVPAGECPDCGALCYIDKPAPPTPKWNKKRPQRIAYAFVPTDLLDPTKETVSPIIVKEGERGYYPTDYNWNRKHAEEARDQLNARLGLKPKEAKWLLEQSFAPGLPEPDYES